MKNSKTPKKTSGLWAEAWIRFRRNRLAMIGLAMVMALLALAIFAPLFAPFDPFQQLMD